MPLPHLPFDHVGIAVRSISNATGNYEKLLGAKVVYDEEVSSQKVRVRFLKYGNAPKIELLEATDPSSPIAKFIAKRGEGIHHIAFHADDIYREYDRLTKEGFELLQKEPIPGAANKLIFFIHPKSMGGTLVEICQPR